MAKRIKGITIEIGGDTTKLDKALSGVNKELKNTQNDLKDVDRLLKLDPKNTELLAQKQRLLSNAVSQTKEKLDTMKKAADAANTALADGKISQRDYDAIQRELQETELAFQNAQRAVVEFKETAPSVQNTMDSMAASADKVASATKVISTAAGAAVAGLVGLAAQAGKTADELLTLSQQSGFPADQLQQWDYAAAKVDVDVDTIVSAASKLKRNMGSTSESVTAAFKQLGVAVKGVNGEYRDSTDVFYQTLDSLSHIENETERDILAMTLFGKSADQLAGIIDDGGKSLREYGQQAREAGLILSDEALEGANKFKDGLDELKVRGKMAFTEAGAALAENLLPFLDELLDVGTDVLGWVSRLDGDTLKAVTGVLAAVALVSPVAKTISGICNAFSTLNDIFAGMNAKTALLVAVLGTLAILAGTVAAAWEDMSGLQKVVAVLGLVTAAAISAAIAFGAFSSAMSMGLAAVGIAAGIAAVVAAVTSAQKTTQNMTSSSTAIPHLANGGVAGANKPFMALVGDNPNEPEVIAPYSMIRQAASDAISNCGSAVGGATNVNIRFEGDLAQLAHLMRPYIETDSNLAGPSLAGGVRVG